jgi:hypothetical protein
VANVGGRFVGVADSKRAVLAALTAVPFLAGCPWQQLNDVKCDISASTVRVNERGDENEGVSHPQAAAEIGGGRILVAFVSQSLEADPDGTPTRSEVRFSIITPMGDRVYLCNGAARDLTISEAGTYAYAASVTKAPLTVAGRSAAALVSWTQGKGSSDEIRMRFVDDVGCPMGAASFAPYGAFGAAASISWSDSAHSVLATIQDQRDVYAGWIRAVGAAPFSVIATGVGGVGSYAANAIAPDGSAFVVWNDGALGARGAVLAPSGQVLAAGPDGNGFDLGFQAGAKKWTDVSAAASAGRFAAFADVSSGDGQASEIYVRQFAADGAPLGEPTAVAPAHGDLVLPPAGVFVPGDLFVVAWQSKTRRGTLGALFDPAGRSAFNNAACGEGAFSVGARGDTIFQTQSALLVGGADLWIFYTGSFADEPRGTAVGLWRAPFRELWPGPM